MKIRGIKKAVGNYKRINKDGYRSPWYGHMMFDKGTGDVWVDEFYSIGHNTWKHYHDPNIIRVRINGEYTMKNVKTFCEEVMSEIQSK